MAGRTSNRHIRIHPLSTGGVTVADGTAGFIPGALAAIGAPSALGCNGAGCPRNSLKHHASRDPSVELLDFMPLKGSRLRLSRLIGRPRFSHVGHFCELLVQWFTRTGEIFPGGARGIHITFSWPKFFCSGPQCAACVIYDARHISPILGMSSRMSGSVLSSVWQVRQSGSWSSQTVTS
jgi:hypothetical protein